MKSFFFACAAIIGIAVASNVVLNGSGFSTQERTTSASARVE
ncbi:MAG: hypothetical protein VX083_20690 [Pseudomonadota bacterium]|jgi:hypothetical protein|uniref:Uncharacterized protein n=1 Tax=Thalassovita autumnalis TaxID=2072972 RepID=A0A0P1FQG6_9RHOB|nr:MULTISPECIES: hypothetical protein [Thalassovita]MEC7962923.1 hypothetical protein [Pseudomonadota bacterium]MEC8039842.1 hypothetical protein [Pseudomonadota bacterium]MEC8295920.1 hypothetical protein [Pseudomonadota bacterium]CUH67867.1 hypothetical protein TL5118_02372 [Thalassovita autumnalis]CUH70889.1 hypothetical protein TL5120_00669 [Thalassovita autumnalis]|tara:strand:- start:62 stop:187 length:126 start_codon:yes stop_codon:yes gene_type:complete